MKKFSLLLIAGLCFSSSIAIASSPDLPNQPQLIATSVKSKKQLAKEVLIELGINKKYDSYFWNSVDISTVSGTRTKFSVWLQKTLVRVAGWEYVEADYVTRLESDFSEMELQELLNLAKRPLMKKLLRAEIQAYEDTGEKRAKLLFQAWDDYTSNKIPIPRDAF
ncbi:DUF2059 domain-containing protein [Pseudanabaena biceps]|nr:DUF2059 domain-containing protein [Pseudanabaena biceps]